VGTKKDIMKPKGNRKAPKGRKKGKKKAFGKKDLYKQPGRQNGKTPVQKEGGGLSYCQIWPGELMCGIEKKKKEKRPSLR